MKNHDYFSCMDFVQKILQFSPRQLKEETSTARFLMEYLASHNIPYQKQHFYTYVPLLKEANLVVDGKRVPCDGCSMEGGRIIGKSKILNSLLSSAICQNDPNINFNPKCADAFSNSNHYFAPAVSVTHEGLRAVLAGKDVKGEVVVEKKRHRSVNILVGNSARPKVICFAHYDSIKTGAIDNASGVTAMMAIIVNAPESLEDVLYVFAGNEELSYDKPVYWGHGFRAFEKKYSNLMEQAKRIIPIDSLGNGKTILITDPSLIKLGFPIANFQKWKKKIAFVTGDFDHLMTVYHSEIDDGRGLSEEYLQDAVQVISEEVSRVR